MNEQDVSASAQALFAEDPETFEALVQPIVAGAHARGVAEAFDLLGFGAVLIDRSAQVIHANRRAVEMLRPVVRVADGRLLGRDPRLTETLRAFVAGAVAPPGDGPDQALALPRRGGATVRLRALRSPERPRDSMARVWAALLVTVDEPST